MALSSAVGLGTTFTKVLATQENLTVDQVVGQAPDQAADQVENRVANR